MFIFPLVLFSTNTHLPSTVLDCFALLFIYIYIWQGSFACKILVVHVGFIYILILLKCLRDQNVVVIYHDFNFVQKILNVFHNSITK